jgi:hypothetical protein
MTELEELRGGADRASDQQSQLLSCKQAVREADCCRCWADENDFGKGCALE